MKGATYINIMFMIMLIIISQPLHCTAPPLLLVVSGSAKTWPIYLDLLILTLPHHSDLLNIELLLRTPHIQLQSIGKTPTIHNHVIHGQFLNHQLDQNEKTCILATLRIPSNLGSSSSTNQPSSVNLGGWALDIRFVDWRIYSMT